MISKNVVYKPLTPDAVGNMHHDRFSSVTEMLQYIESEHGAHARLFTELKLSIHGGPTVEQTPPLETLLESQEYKGFNFAFDFLVSLNPDSPFSDREKALVATELAKIPLPLLKLMYELDLTVLVTHDNVTTARPELQLTQPRGHSHSTQWDMISGSGGTATAPQTVIALIQHEQQWQIPKYGEIAHGSHNIPHGSKNLVLHEVGHAIDNCVGDRFFNDKLCNQLDFWQAWHSDWYQLDSDYYRQGGDEAGRSEAFAEAFARHYEKADQFQWQHLSTYFANQSLPEIKERHNPKWWLQQLEKEFDPQVRDYVYEEAAELFNQSQLRDKDIELLYGVIKAAPFQRSHKQASVGRLSDSATQLKP